MSDDAGVPGQALQGPSADARYRALIEASTRAVWTMSPQGFVEDLTFWTVLTGQITEEAFGDGWLAAVHPDDRARIDDAWRDAFSRAGIYTCEYRLALRDRSYRWFRARGVPIKTASGAVQEWIGVLDEIDGERRARAGRDLLDRTTRRLAQSLDAAAALAAVSDFAVPEFADACAVYALGDAGPLIRIASRAATPALESVLAHLDLAPVLAAPSLEAARPVNIDDAQLPHAMAVRVPTRDGVAGVLLFALAPTGRAYDDHDAQLVEDLASRVGAAVENAKAYGAERAAREAAERLARRLDALQHATAQLAAAQTPTAVADVIIRAALPAVGASRGSVGVLSAAGDSVVVIGAMGYEDDIIDAFRAVPLTAGFPLGDAIRTGRAIVLPDAAAYAEHYPGLGSLRERNGSGSILALPLRADDKMLGAMAIHWRDDHAVGEEERMYLDALAIQCAQALDRIRLYDDERKARAAAEDANRAKSDFLAAMSHELRTPLNAIAGYVELMEIGVRGPLSDQVLTDLGRIRRSQQHLHSLIEDVLAFARIEAGRLDVECGPVPLAETLASLEPMIRPQLAERRVGFVREGCDPALVVHGARDRIVQVVLNLLTNAVKATAPGGRILLRCDADAERVRVRVSDTGVGIPADKLDAIFAPFTQLGRSLNAPRTGVGLGLSISRALAGAMGGRLSVESEVGAGSVFTLELRRHNLP